LDRLPDEEAVALIMDAILDEDVGVRTAAIHQACLRAVPDWELVLRQSLKDPAAAIRQAAVGALLTRRDMASRRVLADFLKTNTDAELAEFVRNQLVRLNRVPNSGALPGRGQPRLRVGDE